MLIRGQSCMYLDLKCWNSILEWTLAYIVFIHFDPLVTTYLVTYCEDINEEIHQQIFRRKIG